MYVDMLQNCKQDVTKKLEKIKQKHPTINIESDSDDKFMDDSDSEDEFMDALEEIHNPNSAQSIDVTLACNSPKNETHEPDSRQIPAQVENSDVKLDCEGSKSKNHEINKIQNTTQPKKPTKYDENTQKKSKK